jgi:hypothetical protein
MISSYLYSEQAHAIPCNNKVIIHQLIQQDFEIISGAVNATESKCDTENTFNRSKE